MERQRAQVLCDDCETWIAVEEGSETVACDCGNRFVVTVTQIPARVA
ncbi:MAG: hypothetical protein V5A45_00070 [Haloarculaceae archaeon]